jgi:predicted DNA-binding antitoxin AbrB/MazE fold protein
MSRSVEAIYKNGEIHPLEPLDLPDETRLTLIIGDIKSQPENSQEERRPDPLAFIHEIAEDAGPADLSTNLDHYLYGLQKKG